MWTIRVFWRRQKGAEVRHRPIQSGQVKQTCHHPGGLPQRQPEERLQRQAGLDRGIGEDRLTPALAGRRGQTLRLRIEPDRRRSALRQRRVIVMPVRGAVGGGLRFAHAHQLPRWIHKVNPSSHLCNSAGRTPERVFSRLGRSGNAQSRAIMLSKHQSNHPACRGAQKQASCGGLSRHDGGPAQQSPRGWAVPSSAALA